MFDNISVVLLLSLVISGWFEHVPTVVSVSDTVKFGFLIWVIPYRHQCF